MNSNMASEIGPSDTIPLATEASFRGKPFDVFLNFRGIDTRYGFTDHLYQNLKAAGVKVFRDDKAIRQGERLSKALINGIRQSKISIPIFSQNYVSQSKWCLRELAEMEECMRLQGQKILPIFYKIEPSQVKNYDLSPYTGDSEVKKWKKALANIVGKPSVAVSEEPRALEGLVLKDAQYEGETVNIIVNNVLLALKLKNAHLPKSLVGMGNHIVNLKELLDIDSTDDVRVIGIVGMSGIGKTTIAKSIYNELNMNFDSHCFLEDVGRTSQQKVGLISLQKQLISTITNREKPDIEDVDKGTKKIEEAIGGKVLIVFDNVDADFQIEKLLIGGSDAFKELCGKGSRIIITTTNKRILLVSKVTNYDTYEPKPMEYHDALELFSKHAFPQSSLPECFYSLAEKVVLNARGLPLVLVVIGSLLEFEKDKGSWEATSNKLMATSHSNVLERLRIGYDALDFEQKQIFLDIACFFSGEDKQNPFYMWNDCGFHPSEGITALTQRSLITVGEGDNILKMHDQLIKLGRQIVKEKAVEPYMKDPWERSRLWDREEVLETLKIHPGMHNTEALSLEFGRNEFHPVDSYPNGEDFAKLPKLRYLDVSFSNLSGDFKNVHSRLRWLKWRKFSKASTPTKLSLKNLVILELSLSDIYNDWECFHDIQVAQKLKVLNLSNCVNLKTVPHLSNFTSLEHLDLLGCRSLQMIGELKELVLLTSLRMTSCWFLEILPDLSKLGKLRTLDIRNCIKITSIPGLQKLESLELLNISSCHSLQGELDLSNLRKLTSLSAEYCMNLTKIQGIDALGSLKQFDTYGCTSLNSLPDLSNLQNLRRLELKDLKVTSVQGLSELESLEQLIVMEMENLESLPNLSNFTSLRKLCISSSDKLNEIQGLHRLESLELLELFDCKSITKLTGLSNLKGLKGLIIRNLDALIDIPDLNELQLLKFMVIFSCYALVNIPNLGDLKSLKELQILSLNKLTNIQGLEKLESLELLDIVWCRSIERLPDLSNLKELKEMKVSYCDKLIEILGLEELNFLQKLNIFGCNALQTVPNLPNTTIESSKPVIRMIVIPGGTLMHEIFSGRAARREERDFSCYPVSLQQTMITSLQQIMTPTLQIMIIILAILVYVLAVQCRNFLLTFYLTKNSGRYSDSCIF